MEILAISNWFELFPENNMCKFRCRSNYLPISQSRFIDDLWMLIVFVHFVLVKLAMKYNIFYLVRFYEERHKFIGNFPVYLTYPDIHQVQKLLNPENSNDLKKITQFIDIIMTIFEHRNDWDISFDWFLKCLIVVSLPCKAVLLMHCYLDS